jgi:hypothetical protein
MLLQLAANNDDHFHPAVSEVPLEHCTRIYYLSAQTAFYSLNPDRDIPGPLAINLLI